MAFWKRLKRGVKKIGPGFITGAADDDPSGIATYSIAGAQFGYGMTWMALFLIPAMIAIQEMCGRIGLVSGSGLAGVIKKYRSKGWLWSAVTLLLIANTVNIGADLGIIASSLQMVLGGQFYVYLLLTTTVVILLEILVPYKRYTKYLKWLAVVLFAYVITAFLVKQNWSEIFVSTLIPKIVPDISYILTMIGFVGTTISPYLFFWQTSEEVEEDIAKEKIIDFGEKPVIELKEVAEMKRDTRLGMIFSNMITFFIILTTAATLHQNGIFDIETPQQAARALRPLAGDFAYLLFAVGVIGIGLQAIPVLAGSAAYAVADAFSLPEGLSKKYTQAKGFYLVIILSLIAGMAMNLLGINTIKALFYAAIINGIVSIPLIWMIIGLADDARVVGRYRSSKWGKLVARITLIFISISVLILFGSIFD